MTLAAATERLAYWRNFTTQHRSYAPRAAYGRANVAHLSALVAGDACRRCGQTLDDPESVICVGFGA